MGTRIRKVVEDLLPPLLVRQLRRAPPDRGMIRFTGDHPDWGAALSESTGYDAPVILERTRDALRKVRDGEVAFERDSVVFAEQDYQFPLLACLLRAALESRGELNVLDFGGSLGSSYFQCRSFLPPLARLRWNIVEQAKHVECGRREFANEQLKLLRESR